MKWKFETKKLSDLKPWNKNPRKITSAGLEKLNQSISKFGIPQPLIINCDGTIIGGHARYKSLNKQNIPEVMCAVPTEQLTEKQLEELNIRLNANIAGEFDFDMLESEFNVDKLLEWGMESKEFEFEIEKISEKEINLLSAEKVKDVDDLSSVFDLKKNVKFKGAGLFDLPILKKDMILEMSSPNTWAGRKATTKQPPYFYNFGNEGTIGLPFEKTVVGFYAQDSKFESIWTDTANIVKRFLNKKIIGIVSPNFSTYFNWPKALRIFNIYRSRWVARYFQESGIPVIPDITGSDKDIDFMFDGLPVNIPVSLQAHMKYSDKAIAEKNVVLHALFEKINPTRVWVYASEDRKQMFPILKDKRVEFLEPRTKIRRDYFNAEHKKIKEVEK